MGIALVLGLGIGAVVLFRSVDWDAYTETSRPPGPAPPGKVWSEDHGHWHDVR